MNPNWLPDAVPQFGSPILDPVDPAGYPLAPYGMGDCRTFLDIPPIVYFEDGSRCINPDFEAITQFTRSALAVNPAAPNSGFVPVITLPAGATIQLQLTADREENGLGHYLIGELLMNTDPGDGILNLFVEIKTLQGDMTYTNAPVPASEIFGTAFLNLCLKCPIMLYPNQVLVFTVTNRGAVPVEFEIKARGRRFMPWHDLRLVQSMERCWSHVMQSVPFWLTFDGTGSIDIPTGGFVPQAQMSVPGGGFFELVYPRCSVIGGSADDIQVTSTSGRVGRRAMDGAVSLGAHYATPTIAVAGFPGGLYRAAEASHCLPPTQIYRGTTRLIHSLRNFVGDDVQVRLTYHGCMHYVGMCPPESDLDLVRRYGHGDARALQRARDQGDRVYLGFFDENPLYVEVGDCEELNEGKACSTPGAGLAGLGSMGVRPAQGEWEAI